jgi:hypothetical protein
MTKKDCFKLIELNKHILDKKSYQIGSPYFVVIQEFLIKIIDKDKDVFEVWYAGVHELNTFDTSRIIDPISTIDGIISPS